MVFSRFQDVEQEYDREEDEIGHQVEQKSVERGAVLLHGLEPRHHDQGQAQKGQQQQTNEAVEGLKRMKAGLHFI